MRRATIDCPNSYWNVGNATCVLVLDVYATDSDFNEGLDVGKCPIL